MSRPMHRLLFAALLLFLPTLSSAGDFLTLERAPVPDGLNADGIPIYESYWKEPKGLPNTCAEAIGEEGAQLYAERVGWKKLLTAPDKGKSRQGFNQVWEDEKTGIVIVIDAQGRGANVSKELKLPKSHGIYKDSIEWCIDACRNDIESPKTTEKSKEVAEIVLQKISEGKFESRVIVTSHVHGVPVKTRTEFAVLEVPEEYLGKTPDELLSLSPGEGDIPEEYQDDPNLILYDPAE